MFKTNLYLKSVELLESGADSTQPYYDLKSKLKPPSQFFIPEDVKAEILTHLSQVILMRRTHFVIV